MNRFLQSQTFGHHDVYILIILFFMELLLSADNILAISLILQRIHPKRRKLALAAGAWSTIIFRGVLIFSASILFLVNPLKVLAGCYLVYIAYTHVRNKKKLAKQESKPISLLKGIFLIELSDLLFALDSIFIALGILTFFYTKELIFTKIWIVFIAGAMGVLFLRFLASSILQILQKYPAVEKASYLIIGWIGFKLILVGFNFSHKIPYFNLIFAIEVILILLYSFFSTKSPSK